MFLLDVKLRKAASTRYIETNFVYEEVPVRRTDFAVRVVRDRVRLDIRFDNVRTRLKYVRRENRRMDFRGVRATLDSACDAC